MPDWISSDWFLPSTLRDFVWANPFYLYLILGLPLLFVLRWFFGGNNGENLSLSLNPRKTGTLWLTNLRFISPLLFFLALVLILIALARPQKAIRSEDAIGEGISIILAIDISESMRSADLLPNRLEAAKQVASDFLKKRTNDKIGLVVFAGESVTVCPLTSDYHLLTEYLNKVSWEMINSSGTAIGNAIATSVNRLRDSPGKSKAIILLSDGDNTAGNLSPYSASDLAKSFDIRIYTIAIGKNNGSEIVNTKILNDVATNSNGEFYSAISKESLTDIFDNIDEIEKTRFSEIIFNEVTDYYYVYLNWALLVLLIVFLLKNTFLSNALED